MPKPLLITLAIAVPVLLTGISSSGWVGLLALGAILVASPIIWVIRKNRYFKSEEFNRLRSDVASVVSEHKDR